MCFYKKNYKVKFSTSSILKKKTEKDYFGKKRKKNHIGKHYSNSQYIFLNDKIKFSTSSILKKKSAKIILKKNI